MDMTVLNLALPTLAATFRPSASQLLWMVDIYGFLVAGFLITMGTLGDRFGRRRLLLVGAAAFAVASTLAAFARSAEMLIAMRALLGVAGATLAPSTLSLIRNMFHDDAQRQFAIGVWIASFSVGGVIGPLVGGVLLEWFWWGSVFLVAVPVMALLLLLGPWLLPEYRDPHAGRIDGPSVGLSLAAVLCVVYGLKRLAEHGPDAEALLTAAAGVLLGWVFVRRQATLDYPLLDVALLRQRRFAAAIAAYGLSCLAMMGLFISIAQYLQGVLGLSPLMAGLATVPSSLAFAVGSLGTAWATRRWGPSAVFVRGLLVAAAGFGLIALAGTAWGLALLVGGTVLMGLGMAPVFAVGNEMIITSAPAERAGAASALSETSAEFSGALGIALFGSLGTALYQARLLPGLAAGTDRAAVATLGAALDTAQALPPAAGEALRTAARAAFVDALTLAAVGAVALVLGAAWLAARLLRTPQAAASRRLS
jgi:DHA2 family multidrug resistance protein-like MFS transporter